MVARSPRFSLLRCSLVGAALLLAACQTVEPVRVESTFAPTTAFSTRSPADIAVLPVEDGTTDGAAQRHLVFLRQIVMQQLPNRLFSPLSATAVDAALRNDPSAVAPAPGESLLAPATLQKLAGHCAEDAMFALRVDRWDESTLLFDKRLRFQFQAVLVGSDAQVLWTGTIHGEVKAGGVGAAPRDRDAIARSCAMLAVNEMMLQLPRRTL